MNERNRRIPNASGESTSLAGLWAAPYLVLSWVKQAVATLRAGKGSDPSLAIDLALAKVRRREALVSLVRARQEVFIGIVGGAHRLSGRGRVRKLDR